MKKVFILVVMSFFLFSCGELPVEQTAESLYLDLAFNANGSINAEPDSTGAIMIEDSFSKAYQLCSNYYCVDLSTMKVKWTKLDINGFAYQMYQLHDGFYYAVDKNGFLEVLKESDGSVINSFFLTGSQQLLASDGTYLYGIYAGGDVLCKTEIATGDIEEMYNLDEEKKYTFVDTDSTGRICFNAVPKNDKVDASTKQTVEMYNTDLDLVWSVETTLTAFGINSVDQIICGIELGFDNGVEVINSDGSKVVLDIGLTQLSSLYILKDKKTGKVDRIVVIEYSEDQTVVTYYGFDGTVIEAQNFVGNSFSSDHYSLNGLIHKDSENISYYVTRHGRISALNVKNEEQWFYQLERKYLPGYVATGMVRDSYALDDNHLIVFSDYLYKSGPSVTYRLWNIQLK